MTAPHPESRLRRWAWATGYLVLFFAAMTLAGILFLLGGIALVLIPGSLPTWAEAAYVLVGIVGTVGIALVATNGAFHRRVAAIPSGQQVVATAQARRVRWLASLVGAVVIAVVAALARVAVVKLLG